MAADADAADGALARVEQAVRGELRPGDVLGREDDGRLWIVAAELGAPGARALAERLADAVAAVAPLRGAPLTVSIGLAASPADGTDRDALAARADESLYAARAAGGRWLRGPLRSALAARSEGGPRWRPWARGAFRRRSDKRRAHLAARRATVTAAPRPPLLP